MKVHILICFPDCIWLEAFGLEQPRKLRYTEFSLLAKHRWSFCHPSDNFITYTIPKFNSYIWCVDGKHGKFDSEQDKLLTHKISSLESSAKQNKTLSDWFRRENITGWKLLTFLSFDAFCSVLVPTSNRVSEQTAMFICWHAFQFYAQCVSCLYEEVKLPPLVTTPIKSNDSLITSLGKILSVRQVIWSGPEQKYDWSLVLTVALSPQDQADLFQEVFKCYSSPNTLALRESYLLKGNTEHKRTFGLVNQLGTALEVDYSILCTNFDLANTFSSSRVVFLY